jgi:hypothetical protein
MKFDNLDLAPEEQFRRACDGSPLPKKDTAEIVIEEAFWASMLTEENRPCRPRLIHSPREKERGHATHWLAKPVPLNRSSLRKLTPTQGGLGYLVWDHESGIPEIIGIEGYQGGDVCEFTISAPSYGALDVSWNCVRIVALRAGQVSCRSREFLPTESNALTIVWKLLESFEPVYLGTPFARSQKQVTVEPSGPWEKGGTSTASRLDTQSREAHRQHAETIASALNGSSQLAIWLRWTAQYSSTPSCESSASDALSRSPTPREPFGASPMQISSTSDPQSRWAGGDIGLQSNSVVDLLPLPQS